MYRRSAMMSLHTCSRSLLQSNASTAEKSRDTTFYNFDANDSTVVFNTGTTTVSDCFRAYNFRSSSKKSLGDAFAYVRLAPIDEFHLRSADQQKLIILFDTWEIL